MGAVEPCKQLQANNIFLIELHRLHVVVDGAAILLLLLIFRSSKGLDLAAFNNFACWAKWKCLLMIHEKPHLLCSKLNHILLNHLFFS